MNTIRCKACESVAPLAGSCPGCGIPGSVEGRPMRYHGPTEVAQLRADLAAMTSERDVYRAMLCDVVASASPNRRDHPTMHPQWERARALLRDGPA